MQEEVLHQLASMPNPQEVLQHQLDSGANLNGTNSLGETPLLSLLRASGPISLVKELLVARAEVNCRDMMGETPLMEAACIGDQSLCLLLLQSRADLDQRNLQGQRAEDLAKAADFLDLAHLLGNFTWTSDDATEPPGMPKRRPAPRAPRGALRQRCEEKDIPLTILGQLAAADLLREMDRWQQMTLEEISLEYAAQGMASDEDFDRNELEDRLKTLRLWRLLPFEALQDECRNKASHVVQEMSSDSGTVLSREELMEALCVATWGGLTKSQLVSKRCAERGIPDHKLEDRSRAEHILEEFERLEQLSHADLVRLYKSRGFAYADSLPQKTLVENLKEYVLYQEMSLSHLRQVCKEKDLQIKGDHRRADLLKLLTAESWRAFDIPVLKLPSLLVAQGLLDQLQRMAKKDEPQLRAELRRRHLPVENSTSNTKLLSRLRRHLVWAQMSVEDLEEECRQHDLHWSAPPVGRPPMQSVSMVHANSSHKKEMLQLLHDWLSIEMVEAKGISVKLLGREAALAIFMEVERLESMPRSFLEDEYGSLGMPNEPKLEDKELISRLKQVLMWSQLEADQLLEECQCRQLHVASVSKLCDEEKRQILLDKLMMSLGVDSWEKQGIPVTRLTSLDCALGIVEELSRLEEVSDKEVKDAYKLLGLPKETGIDRAAMISRLKHYMIWQDLRPSELRKECLKYNLSPAGSTEELIAILLLKFCGFVVEESHTIPEWSGFQPPPRTEKKTSAAPTPSGKVASAFHQLGLEITARQDEVRRTYRRLALRHHPDKNPNLPEEAAKKFQQITSAYETIMAHLKVPGSG